MLLGRLWLRYDTYIPSLPACCVRPHHTCFILSGCLACRLGLEGGRKASAERSHKNQALTYAERKGARNFLRSVALFSILSNYVIVCFSRPKPVLFIWFPSRTPAFWWMGGIVRERMERRTACLENETLNRITQMDPWDILPIASRLSSVCVCAPRVPHTAWTLVVDGRREVDDMWPSGFFRPSSFVFAVPRAPARTIYLQNHCM